MKTPGWREQRHKKNVAALLSAALCCACLLLMAACLRGSGRPACAGTELVFKHGRIGDSGRAIRTLLSQFEEANPDICVREEELPSSTDEQHQYYVINLESRSAAFDIYALDVIWLQAFAKAGWLLPLKTSFDASEVAEFFDAAVKAATFNGQLYAAPWFVDAGVLYYRRDLLDEYGFKPPVTWNELADVAAAIVERQPGLYGFVWQGKQYEGLVCNMLEYLWSNGGAVLRDGGSALLEAEDVAAMEFVQRMIIERRISPPFITTLDEESARQIYGSGRAVFMRNWPYAWRVFQRQKWAVAGNTGIAPLPSFAGHKYAAALGGWHLGVNSFSSHPFEALRLLKFLVSLYSQKQVALSVGYQPALKALYSDTELLQQQPWLGEFRKVMEHARPRPVTPYYMMISQILQPEFSAIVAGLREPAKALESASRRVDFIMGSAAP